MNTLSLKKGPKKKNIIEEESKSSDKDGEENKYNCIL